MGGLRELLTDYEEQSRKRVKGPDFPSVPVCTFSIVLVEQFSHIPEPILLFRYNFAREAIEVLDAVLFLLCYQDVAKGMLMFFCYICC